MKHLQKRLASIFLTLCMVLSLLPTMAFAEEEVTPNPPAITAEESGTIDEEIIKETEEEPAEEETKVEEPAEEEQTEEAAADEYMGEPMLLRANAAAPTKLWVNNVDVLTNDTDSLNGVTYDADSNTLTLTNADLRTHTYQNTERGTAVIYVSGGNLTINLVGKNTITYGDYSGGNWTIGFNSGILFSNANLTFTGSGSLNLKNSVTDKTTYGIYGTNSSSLTIDDTTVQCDAENRSTDKMDGSPYGIAIDGALTMNGGKLEVYTRDTAGKSGNVATGISLGSTTATHKLTGDAEIISVAGLGSNGWITAGYSYGILIGSQNGLTLENIGENARLYFSGESSVVKFLEANTLVVKADSTALSAKGSTTYNVASESLKDITLSSSNQIIQNDIKYPTEQKTLEITKKVNYASAALTLKGYKKGVSMSGAAIKETSKAGLSAITLDGFSNSENGAFAKDGNFDSTTQYYVKVSLTPESGYSVKTNGNGIPTDITLDGATAVKYDSTEKYIIFKMDGEPADNIHTKRTTTLNLTTISQSQPQDATYDSSTNTYTNEDEGWTWNATTKTLTLDNCTIAVEGNGHGIYFPDTSINLVLKGTNSVTGGKASPLSCALYQDGNYYSITISEESGSNGTLTAGTNSTDSVIRCGTLTLNSGSVTLENTNADQFNSGSGLELSQNLNVTGGTLNAMGFEYSGISCSIKATISGGHVTVSGNRNAIESNGRAISADYLNIGSGENLKIKAGDSADTATRTTDKDTYRKAKYIDIDFNAPPDPAVFTDGFGGTVSDPKTYTKGTTTNNKGYSFGGWFDENGDELTDTDTAKGNTTYTAGWTAENGKLVRTTALDLSTRTSSTGNTREGWRWMQNTKTLTLDGATIDVPENANAEAAITLPNGATITTTENTKNTVINNATSDGSGGILGKGALTIEGSGKLSIAGTDTGIYAENRLTINTAIHATAKAKGGAAVMSEQKVDLGAGLRAQTPNGEKLVNNTEMGFIADSNEAPASDVVIAVAPPVFTDGFGDTSYNFDSFTYGQKNSKGYNFAGWYDEYGSRLRDVDDAVNGATYTAKWTKNGKTVRTNALDLTKISENNSFGAMYSNGVYTNTAEGWIYDTTSNTLTLNGATWDITLEEGTSSYAAVRLPADATLTTAEGTENRVTMNSERSGAIIGDGNLTIDGKGALKVIGTESGIGADGDITINAPISVSVTGLGAILIESEAAHTITIAPSLSIKTPVGGKVASTYIADSNGVPAKEVVIDIAQKYTVTYNTNGGTAVAADTATENSKLTKPADPTKDGYYFIGWYKDAAFTTPWNFETDTVTGDVTLYARWSTEPLFSISGSVKKEQESSPAQAVAGATVALKKGSTVIASATTDENGSYTFTGVPNGEYNIVATKENGGTTEIKTTLITVSNGNQNNIHITLPKNAVSSIVEVKAGTPAVLVGGLDDEAAYHAADNQNVSVKLVVEAKTESSVPPAAATAIKQLSSGKTLAYVDMTVEKTVKDNSTNNTTSISQTNNVLEIVVPFQTNGRSGITVYRHHAVAGGTDEAKAFTKLDTRPTASYADGTFFVGDGFVVIYTQKFSTYAIGYTTSSGGGGGSSSGGSSGGGSSHSGNSSNSSNNSNSISTPDTKNGTVSVDPKNASEGAVVTVTVTPDKGYTLETLTVTDADGKSIDLNHQGNGKYTFRMPAGKVEIHAAFMEDNTMLNHFVDVPASAYYYNAVLWAAENGITGGTDATHFSPDSICTRAQAVTFLWRAAGSPAPKSAAMPFTDVAAGSYYYDAVLWAVENGIAKGTSDTTFSPNANCSRGHIVSFLWRSQKSPAADTVNPFTDVKADAYYADAVLWAVKENVTSGTAETTFSPDANCTRAQIVTFIQRMQAE